MRILQVISYFNPKFGGDINVCTFLSRELVKRNHEVTIITTDYQLDMEYADNIRAEGISVIPFPCTANIGLFLYSPSIKTWCKQNLNGFDVIHIHNYRSYQNIAVRKFAMKFGVPYIIQAHGTVLPIFAKIWLKKLYDFFWGNKVLQDASQLIALTSVESDQYIQMGVKKEKIVMIPNGIVIFDFEQLNQTMIETFFERYSIPQNKKILLFIGRLHRIKNLALLIDALNELIKTGENVILIVIGDDWGSMEDNKNKVHDLHIEKSVFFLGFVTRLEKFIAYKSSDVFILPSVYDAFPITVLEAWMCGIPVIVTSGCCMRDVVKEAGCVVDLDYLLLSNTIRTLLNDYDLKTTLIENGMHFVKERYTWDKVIVEMLEVYENLQKNSKYM